MMLPKFRIRRKNVSASGVIVIATMALLCLDFTASHSLMRYGGLYVDGWGRTVSQLFLDHTVQNNKVATADAVDRENVEVDHQLSQRHKLRWVYLASLEWSTKQILSISKTQKLVHVGMAFLYLYSIVFGVFLFSNYLFLLDILTRIRRNKNDVIYFSAFSYLLVLCLIFFLHWRGGGYETSVIEASIVMSAICFVLRDTKRSVILYGAICILAPLLRESGLVVSGFYLLYHYIVHNRVKPYGFIFPLLSGGALLLFNVDIFSNVFKYGFMFTFESQEGQLTFNNVFQSPGSLISLFYNYALFFVPIVILFRKKSRLQRFFLVLIAGYFFMLLIATPLEHLSPKLMPALLLIIYCFIGLRSGRETIELDEKCDRDGTTVI